MNKDMSKFDFKISIDQFCEIKYISQIVHQNDFKYYSKKLDTWSYIFANVQVKWSSKTYYFRGSKLLDKSYQLYQTKSLCTIWDILEVTSKSLL